MRKNLELQELNVENYITRIFRTCLLLGIVGILHNVKLIREIENGFKSSDWKIVQKVTA